MSYKIPLVVVGLSLLSIGAEAERASSATGRRGNATIWNAGADRGIAASRMTGPKGKAAVPSAMAMPDWAASPAGVAGATAEP